MILILLPNTTYLYISLFLNQTHPLIGSSLFPYLFQGDQLAYPNSLYFFYSLFQATTTTTQFLYQFSADTSY